MPKSNFEAMAGVIARVEAGNFAYVPGRGMWFFKTTTNSGKSAWWPDENFLVWNYIHDSMCGFAEGCGNDSDTIWLRSAKSATAVETILRSKLVGSEEAVSHRGPVQ